jgi:hypothetical protein
MKNYLTKGSLLMQGALLLLLIAIAAPSFAEGVSDGEIKKIFPNVESLDGGAEMWLNTGVRKTPQTNHTIYSTTYSYFSGKAQKLMNIVRKKKYETNIAVYSFNNFVDAAQYYRELTKDAPENRSQQVRFGERGLFFLYPKSGYINDADFYLVFINKTFVVWMHADDGFALMDIANPVNEAMDELIVNNTELYLMKRITVEAFVDGYKVQSKPIEFTNDFPSSIKVSGKVFDKNVKPMPVATVNILETGDSFYTDNDGYFEHTIMLDGINDIELSTNFYLEEDRKHLVSSFKDGLLEANVKASKNKKSRTQLWKLEKAGDKIFGTAYVKTSKGYKEYPMKGEVGKGDQLTLHLDCSRAGTNFKCEQNFVGKVSKSGINGVWTGTGGGGSFFADSQKFSVTQRKITVSDQIAQIKTFAVGFDGKLQRSDDSILNIASGHDSNAMLFIKPYRTKLKLDNIKTISAKLVLTHLPKNQKGNFSIFKYEMVRNGTKASLGKSKYAGQLVSSEEPYKTEIDITDMLTENDDAFIVGGVPEAGSIGNHLFSPVSSKYDFLKPFIVVSEYSEVKRSTITRKPFKFFRKLKESTDLIADTNKPKPDGVKDYCFETVFNYPDKKLTNFNLEISNGVRRKYNTNPLDIYPLVGIIKNGKLLNSKNGAVSYTFGSEPEKINICINGSYKPAKTDRISYRYTIGGKSVEGIVD